MAVSRFGPFLLVVVFALMVGWGDLAVPLERMQAYPQHSTYVDQQTCFA